MNMTTNKYEHFTLDIETLSTEPNAVVLSFALAAFDPAGIAPTQVYSEQYLNVDEQLRNGRHVSGSTLMWWLGMSPAARAVQTNGTRERVGVSLVYAARWIAEMTGELPDNSSNSGIITSKVAKIWGNGKDFDCVVLGHLYRQEGLPTPWEFRNTRCFRDLYIQHRDVQTASASGEVAHSAEGDARWEARHLQNVVKNKGIALY
jgi:hypothetical protein